MFCLFVHNCNKQELSKGNIFSTQITESSFGPLLHPIKPLVVLGWVGVGMGVVLVGSNGVVVVVEVKGRQRERQRQHHTLLINAHHIGIYS